MSHNSALLCKVNGSYVNIPLTWSDGAWPSKASLIKWYFECQKISSSVSLKEGSVTTTTARGGKKSLPLPVLSPVVPGIPRSVLPPVVVIGAVPVSSKAGPNVVTHPQSFTLELSGAYGYNYPTGSWRGGSVARKFTFVNSRNGIDLPRWKSIIRSGGNATTSMSASRTEVRVDAISHVVRWKGGGSPAESFSGFNCYVQPTILTTGYSDSLLLSNADSLALGKLNGRLMSLHTDTRIGETIGEMMQTVRMLSGPLDGMRRMWDNYMKQRARLDENRLRNIISYGTYIDALARLWLELVFGWQPLILQVNEVVDSLAGIRAKMKTSVSASWKNDKVLQSTSSRYTNANYCVRDFSEERKLIVTVRYKVGVNPDKVPVHGVLGRLGVTPRELIPTLYAVTPYSWLFDYFTSLNNVIDALFADVSFVSWSVKTVRRESVVKASDKPNDAASVAANNAPGATSSGTAGQAVTTRVDITRSIPTSLIPIPTLKMPGGWRAYANIAALLASKFVKPAAHAAYNAAMADSRDLIESGKTEKILRHVQLVQRLL